jgi:hypothetical protein
MYRFWSNLDESSRQWRIPPRLITTLYSCCIEGSYSAAFLRSTKKDTPVFHRRYHAYLSQQRVRFPNECPYMWIPNSTTGGSSTSNFFGSRRKKNEISCCRSSNKKKAATHHRRGDGTSPHSTTRPILSGHMTILVKTRLFSTFYRRRLLPIENFKWTIRVDLMFALRR